jgi:UDP-glucuronate 4-epimerase
VVRHLTNFIELTPNTRILVTGAAGFIGAHLSRRLVQEGCQVTGLDNLNDYYDVALKRDRLQWIKHAQEEGAAATSGEFSFVKLDLADRTRMADFFDQYEFDLVVHLAAQAGVRHSLHHPLDFVDSNLVGFAHVLEGCRVQGVRHLVYASSSSVYGENKRLPFSEHHSVDHPVSFYGATKKANELMAHAYAEVYGLPTTGLRFFTVFGPWGRPDMAPMLFSRKILEGEPIDVFNYGEYARDFTYIGDIVEGIVRVLGNPPQPDADLKETLPDPARSQAPWRVFNIGNSQPVNLSDFIDELEAALGKRAIRNLLPAQPGEVIAAWADVTDLKDSVGYRPGTALREGIHAFLAWYLEYQQMTTATT